MFYKVFIDESGQKEYKTPYTKDFINNPPPFDKYEDFWRDNYFVLCGIRIKTEYLAEINVVINKLKKAYFSTHRVEVKSDWLRNPYQRKKHYLLPFQISAEKLNKFGDAFIELIAKYKKEMKIIAVVFDKRYYGDEKRQTPEGIPLLKSTQVLFERLHYAGNLHIVVFDQMESSLRVTKGQQGRILNILQDNSGMEKIYVDKYNTISDIVFVESYNENFIQVADVCAYNIFRQFIKFGREFCQKQDKKISLKMEMYAYFEKIRCNFYYNPLNNKVAGCGLICLPDVNKINWDVLSGCSNNKKTSLK
ncbi:MAG: DUF3800 domain-containing protein [Parcubacteria group bacterium]|nr:DUF3800 domain-containing protein [Parcubacteria group bacterium]